VQVVRVDAGRRQVDFALVEIAEALRAPRRSARAGKPKATTKRERRAAGRPGRRERRARGRR
jgi:hypothetical protein